jgi:hypothetical protein
MKENNPNVRMVIGNVISWRMGLTSKFMPINNEQYQPVDKKTHYYVHEKLLLKSPLLQVIILKFHEFQLYVCRIVTKKRGIRYVFPQSGKRPIKGS